MVKKLEKKELLLGLYVRVNSLPDDLTAGAPCKRIVFSYEPLRNILKNRGISFRALRKNYGLSKVVAANMNNDRPTTLDDVARMCYYLGLTPNDIVEFKFVDSKVTEADVARSQEWKNRQQKIDEIKRAKKEAETPKAKAKAKAPVKAKANPKKKDAPAKKPRVLFDDDEP